MKKTLSIIKTVLVWLVVALAVFMMIFTIFSVSVFNKSDREFFGYKFYTVLTDSMSKTDFNAGDIVVVKFVDPTTLEEGDIITYISQNTENFGEPITHKIRKKTVDANGDLGYITYGTTTNTDDEIIVTTPFIQGKYQFRIAGLGHFFQFLKTPQGYFVCIFIPFMLLIVYQGINCIILFRRYKKEQLEEIQAERDQIEEERRQSLEMMKELQALKEQLAEKGRTDAEEKSASEVSEAETGADDK